MNLKKYPIVIVLSSLISACSSSDFLLNRMSEKLSDQKRSEQFYNILAGELYQEEGNNKQALAHYMVVAMQSNDASIAKRATQIAARSGQNNHAITVAKRWLTLDPKSLEARQYLALLLLRKKSYKASAYYFYSLQKKLDHAERDGVKIIGVLLSSEKQHEAVYQMYQQYQQLEKNQPKVQLILSSFAFKAAHYQQALDIIEPVSLVLQGESKEQALLLQSKILYQLGRDKKAMQILSPLMKSKSTSDVALLEYVRLLILDKRNKDAATVLTRLSEKYPKNLEIKKSLVTLYLDLQQYIEAERYIPNLLLDEEYKSIAHHFRAEIFESRYELDAALDEYKQVKDGELYFSAQNHIPLLLMQQHGLSIAQEWLHQKIATAKLDELKSKFLSIEAGLLLDQKDYQQSLLLYDEAEALTPNSLEIHYNRALVQQELKLLDKAEADFRFVLNIRKNDVETLSALGCMLVNYTNRFDEANDMIRKALSLRPNDVTLIGSLGLLYYRQGQIDKAEHHLRQAYQKNRVPEIARYLIEVLAEKGNQKEAQAIFNEMIKQYPDDDELKRVKQKIIDYNRAS
ncbi:MAG: tetratricopeptide repeat protein [Cocleimonas sp.]|nr:tetratricopeptide repeat protein [Cocleimonas sp.]